MLSQLLRTFNRQTFKSIQSQNYVKRLHTNQELNQNNTNEEKGNEQKYYQFYDFDDYTKVYQEYYKRYYDNFKNKFDTNSSDRQTDSNNDNNYRNHRNNEKFNSNSYSFNECKYNLLTLRLLEKVGYIGTAIVFGLHVERPLYAKRHRIVKSCEKLEEKSNYDNISTKVCGNCKYCETFLSRLWVWSAPTKKNNVLPKVNDNFLYTNKQNGNKSKEDLNENISKDKSFNQITDDLSVTEISLEIKDNSDPIETICGQLERASIDYIDRLNTMLGISLIQTDPNEAMNCWSSAKTKESLFNMGVAFESGRHSTDGKVDLERAHQHYALSASMGHKQAIYNLSLFYLYGKGGISVDLNRAEALLKRAAKLGVKPAENFIQQLDNKRRAQIKQKNFMRSSASAPNLSALNTYFESYNIENSNNNYKQGLKAIN